MLDSLCVGTSTSISMFLKDKELSFNFDVLGQHHKKAKLLGSRPHYSKLKEPVVLEAP